MKRARIFVFNAALAVLLAALYAWAVVERRPDGLEAALRTSWWAGLTVGLTVGAGATLGPRPVLGWKRCVAVQVMIVVSTAVFAFLIGLLPGEDLAAVDRAVHEEMDRRGLRLGSGIGAAVGTIVQIIQVYRERRRAARAR